METINEVVREWIDKVSDAARQRFCNAVKPIYGATEGGDPDHIGSAILLEISEGHFLLTAAHVLDWHESTTLYLGADKTFEPLQFEALVSAAPDGDRNKDHFDFAFAPLNANLVQKLPSAKFITEADISSSTTHTDDQTYTCLGYPNSKNKVKWQKGSKVTPSLVSYTNIGRPATKLPAIATDQNHILVGYDGKYVRDDSGARVNAVALRGCNGGAIIDVGRISLHMLDAPPDPKVAALLIEAHAGAKVIVGTRLTTILTGVRAQMAKTI